MPSAVIQYPSLEVCPRLDVVDEFRSENSDEGTAKVTDPYRWLEDVDSEASKKWIDAQVKLYTSFMSSNCSSTKEKVKALLKERWNYERFSCPFKRGESYFFFHNSGLQDQSVLYAQTSLEGERKVMLDPNTLSDDGTAALKSLSFSKDGSMFVYGVSRSGSDWSNLYIRVVSTGSDLPDVLEWVKFSSISWLHDGSGFFYCRYPKPEKFETKEDEAFERGTEVDAVSSQMVYFHKLGDEQSKDGLVYSDKEHPKHMFSVEVSDCGNYLILCTSESCEPQNQVHIMPLEGSFQPLIDDFRGQFDYVTNEGDVFFFMTNFNAPNNRLVAIELKNPEENNWKEIIPEDSKALVSSISCVDGTKLVVSKLEDVKESLFLYGLDGSIFHTIEHASIATVDGVTGRKEDQEIFYKMSSFVDPGTIYRYDSRSNTKSTFLKTFVPGLVPENYQISQSFFESKDKTMVPMFIIHKKGIELNGNNPVLLYGYGGFNISLTPSFSVTRLTFIDAFNGICAIPNLRGGGEYGRAWHQQGILKNKQNTFDDFQSAAQYLIEKGYTKPEKIAINGGSNGGLLVAACLNQRPELFGCAVAQVGVLDLLRFHKFTIGYAWCSDYGTPEEDFDFMHKISPLHNIREDKPYPSTLITTADHDDRVVPLHSFKFAAELQHKLGTKSFQRNPLLIRIDVKAGHGAGKPLSKTIDEYSDVLAFMANALKC